MKIWFIVAVAFLGGALIGFMVCSFFEKYRLNIMLSLSQRAMEDAPALERLERTVDTWGKLRALFYSWRGGLSPNQYLAVVELMTEMDDRLDFANRRETAGAEEIANDRLLS